MISEWTTNIENRVGLVSAYQEIYGHVLKWPGSAFSEKALMSYLSEEQPNKSGKRLIR